MEAASVNIHKPTSVIAPLSSRREWTLHEYAEVDSTNLMAATLPAWQAIRATTQTAGRGRFHRHWVSDAGGLWLSAVVPVETNSPGWRLLPLVAGLAVCDALRELGVAGLRMRWPNDVLVGEEKLAGLLIDQFCPGRAVVGIGINVRNQPQAQDGSLLGRVTRLADLLPVTPMLHDLALHVLTELRATWLEVQRAGPEEVLSRVNDLWDLSRPVQLDLDGTLLTGEFAGVDAAGRLQLRLPDARSQIFEPHQVRQLRELTLNA